MGKIIILDENTSNKIAAGEVIERPASVVKELIENSIDAKATAVTVEIKNGGISLIKISDNGSGIEPDDAEIAFERHATSKIRSAMDIESISSLGFRGEALASIAAVSSVELITRTNNSPTGTHLSIKGGVVKDVRPTGCPVGTTFIIKELFYNTPARFKFLKKDSTEAGYVSDIISRIALGNPQLSLRLISNGNTVIHSPGNNDLKSVIFSVYGKETAKEIVPIDYKDDTVRIWGYAGKPEIARSNRNYQSYFLNGRFIKSKLISSAIDEAYRTFLMKNKYPFLVLGMEINPILVDINVHPAKIEVRFSDEQKMFRSVYHAVNNALSQISLLKEVQFYDKDDSFRFKSETKENYEQQTIKTPKSIIKENAKPIYEIKGQDMTSKISFTNDILKKEVEKEVKKEHAKEIKSDFKEKDELINSNYSLVTKLDEDIKQSTLNRETKNPNLEPLQNEEKESLCEVSKGSESEINDFKDYKIIGQAFSTYIILQHGNELLFLDQHAAHERIMYERLKNKYINKENLSQVLLVPVVIDMTHKEVKFLEEKKILFESLGFMFENFGNNSIIIRAVPLCNDSDGVKQIFLEVLDKLLNKYEQWDETAADETLYTIACKAAVKANARLDEREIESLINDLSSIENPYTCPHGRPTAIIITKHELEKKFKRIL